MNTLRNVYRHSLALLTDLYQLTMAYGYWKRGRADDEAAFHLFFRKAPFGGRYVVACGLAQVVDYLKDFRFDEDDLRYLGGLTGNDSQPLFDRTFLDYLRNFRLRCDVDAMPEGTVVFPQEPLLRVKGPILDGQILETPLLNLLNFQSLVATKASRMAVATRGDPILEFGLRRAQGIDGALSASRAAYIGGCAATSNLLAGRIYGIPVRGTHAHSWIMAFHDELEAFEEYARAMPNNCVFLVDTYDTLDGVRHAIEVGRRLRDRGHELVGVRLDSGDMVALSIEARRLLDEAGFENAVIVASNDLDEHSITQFKNAGAKIAVWGIGTRLATCHDQPALGGVYKLTAIRQDGGRWNPKIKLSEETGKITNPGILQVRRFSDGRRFIADMIWNDEAQGGRADDTGASCVELGVEAKEIPLPPDATYRDLLVPVLRGGERVYESPPIETIRERARAELEALPAGVKDLKSFEAYPVGLERSLHDLKARLIHEQRNSDGLSFGPDRV